MGIIKSGKVVVVLSGRYAGRKAVVAKTYDSNADRRFGHCLVVGIDRYPRKVTRSMSSEKVAKRSKVKPFVKYLNVRHIMPTRYVVDINVKDIVTDAAMESEAQRADLKKAMKKRFEDRYTNLSSGKSEKKTQGAKYLFQKLRF
mmetsp:Transcript_32917/g.104230  ORF Transcript_32917/g.104230 Transcript_32917/m.104230 type:complete len:144 (-) Transcript_32917:146-577(-)|eukprot:CAMPEP_0118862894 /NCGR_PEP_ID=MMETSP1163-20130328/7959_1 /TAXON_ID=124430 /ORGANISM="Phaeomonas parva, Strain CCMP2877" /LENGTH=143 /DNA_ID=CAMNT_0006796849 /DNA_START=135 /DNA_END=566 /DNA_ORIENTATION=-